MENMKRNMDTDIRYMDNIKRNMSNNIHSNKENLGTKQNPVLKRFKVEDHQPRILTTDKGYSFTVSKEAKVLNEGHYKQIFETTAKDSKNNFTEAVYCQFGFENHPKQKEKGTMMLQEIYEERNLWNKATSFDNSQRLGLVQYLGCCVDVDPESKVEVTASKVYLVFRKYTDGTLEDLLKDVSTLDSKEIKAIAYHLLSGLKALHDKKIIHLDIKPDNILIIRKGGKVVGASLTDLGLSRELVEGKKVYPKNMHTAYAAPEYKEYYKRCQENNGISEPQSLDDDAYGYDIYSMGLTLQKVFNLNSEGAKDFVSEMLSFENDERPDIDYCLEQFMKLGDDAFTHPKATDIFLNALTTPFLHQQQIGSYDLDFIMN